MDGGQFPAGYEQPCKPGSVFGNHLSGTYVAICLKPSVGTGGQPIAPVDVAADRVYRSPMLPWGMVSSYLAFPPLPAKEPAVYLCCTIPRVAPGRRYLLSLPCAARTFLIPVSTIPRVAPGRRYLLSLPCAARTFLIPVSAGTRLPGLLTKTIIAIPGSFVKKGHRIFRIKKSHPRKFHKAGRHFLCYFSGLPVFSGSVLPPSKPATSSTFSGVNR